MITFQGSVFFSFLSSLTLSGHEEGFFVHGRGRMSLIKITLITEMGTEQPVLRQE